MPDTALVTPLGARRFAHPKYATTAATLVRMPWLVCETDGQHIYKDLPQRQAETGEDIASDRLEALGYA